MPSLGPCAGYLDRFVERHPPPPRSCGRYLPAPSGLWGIRTSSEQAWRLSLTYWNASRFDSTICV